MLLIFTFVVSISVLGKIQLRWSALWHLFFSTWWFCLNVMMCCGNRYPCKNISKYITWNFIGNTNGSSKRVIKSNKSRIGRSSETQTQLNCHIVFLSFRHHSLDVTRSLTKTSQIVLEFLKYSSHMSCEKVLLARS